jgi:hypothetical protein
VSKAERQALNLGVVGERSGQVVRTKVLQFGLDDFLIGFAGWVPLDSKIQDLTP